MGEAYSGGAAEPQETAESRVPAGESMERAESDRRLPPLLDPCLLQAVDQDLELLGRQERPPGLERVVGIDPGKIGPDCLRLVDAAEMAIDRGEQRSRNV